jgi:hypothetical protein
MSTRGEGSSRTPTVEVEAIVATGLMEKAEGNCLDDSCPAGVASLSYLVIDRPMVHLSLSFYVPHAE